MHGQEENSIMLVQNMENREKAVNFFLFVNSEAESFKKDQARVAPPSTPLTYIRL